MKPVIIIGSSRTNGETKKKVDQLVDLIQCPLIDLKEYNISHYDYENKNHGDDFLGLLKMVVENYDTLIVATPVYWYSMSGVMKVFFDRCTDLLTIEKELGRELRGKNMAVLSCSNGNNLGEAFWLPFSETANYMGMNYIGNIHTYEEKNDSLELEKFAKLFKN